MAPDRPASGGFTRGVTSDSGVNTDDESRVSLQASLHMSHGNSIIATDRARRGFTEHSTNLINIARLSRLPVLYHGD